jgi:predicted RNA-binding protein with PIN domain
MLVYIIDGFNVVHKIPHVKQSSTPHETLIHYIKKNKLTGSKNNKVIVVFDGRFRDLNEKEFEVVFSGEASADELIKKKLDKIKIKSEVIVVSDDKQIREFTIKSRAKSYRVQAFLSPKKTPDKKEEAKDISYPLQREITEEMRKIWLKEE